jgi:hypothetical protein
MSSTIILPAEREKLFSQVLNLLGAPVRSIEITEEQLDTFLELSLFFLRLFLLRIFLQPLVV